MTHPNPAGSGSTAAILPTMPDVPTARPAGPSIHQRLGQQRRLDRARLREGVLARQRHLTEIEAEMVAACEKAATRGAARAVQISDRATWDRSTWQRYLDAAARLEPEYGPKLRRLYQEIDQLNRLIALPTAA